MPFFLSQILPSTLFHLTLSTADAKRSNNPGSSHWGHRRGHSPSLSPLCLHPATLLPTGLRSRCAKPPPFSGSPASPARISGGEEKQVAKYNKYTHHPRPVPCTHAPAWSPRPGQLHQEAEEIDWCG